MKSRLTFPHLLAVLVAGAFLIYLERQSSGTGFALFFVAALVLIYFIPATVARSRHKRNATAITVLNVFLGWTFVGWVVALVWACTEDA